MYVQYVIANVHTVRHDIQYRWPVRRSLKPGTHYPYTGRKYGPYIGVSKMTPVYTSRIYGPHAIPDVNATQNNKYDVIVNVK